MSASFDDLNCISWCTLEDRQCSTCERVFNAAIKLVEGQKPTTNKQSDAIALVIDTLEAYKNDSIYTWVQANLERFYAVIAQQHTL